MSYGGFQITTMQQKLYQLIISRLNGHDIHSEAYRARIIELVRKGIGGFIVFGGELESIRSFIDEMQSLAEIPLFIASDIERGVGQQINGCTIFPSQMAFSAAVDKHNPEDVCMLRDAVRAIALEATDVGINMPLIPVLDINSNPDNPIICTRAFSDNAGDVSWFGTEYIKALEGTGLISCAKHFPGHGDTSIDSHIALPVITKSYDELVKTELVPFVEAVNAGVRSIMVGHLTLPAVDSAPASLSAKIITEILRKKLGFNGLIITDALNMSALDDFDNVPARCMSAGIDILLHPTDPDVTVKQLEEAIYSGMLDKGIIDNAVERIIKAKRDLSKIKKVHIDYNKHEALSEHITERAITLVKAGLTKDDENGRGRNVPHIFQGRNENGWDKNVPPILDIGLDRRGFLTPPEGFADENVQLIIAGEKKFYDPSVWDGMGVDTKGFSTPPEGFSHSTTIFAIFSETAGWKGRSGINEQEKDLLIDILKSSGKSIVISLGSPYVLRYFSDADVLIAAYGNNEKTQRAVMNCLMGKIEFNGRLPVKIVT
ncbi:MAG: hypothetical protein HZA08_09570 [Nitrospirae bacterium]|nr:hypothetical protein [Nitrospirota bacterium]